MLRYKYCATVTTNMKMKSKNQVIKLQGFYLPVGRQAFYFSVFTSYAVQRGAATISGS